MTLYRLPQRAAFERWARAAPRDFAFALEGSRFVTHVKRLAGARAAVAALLQSAAPLGERLARVLWRLPPRWRADPGRLEGSSPTSTR